VEEEARPLVVSRADGKLSGGAKGVNLGLPGNRA